MLIANPTICHGNSRPWTCVIELFKLPTPARRRSIIMIRPANMHIPMTCDVSMIG